MNIRSLPWSALQRSLSEAAACRRGIAAVEFAMVLPIMALLFFGMLEASDLLTVKRRLANASNSLVDLIAQEPSITVAQLDDSVIGVTRLLEPTDTSTLSIRVVSLVRGPNPGDPATVHWSRDENGATPYAAGSVYAGLDDDETINSNASMLVVEFDYDYNSGLSGRVFTTPFNFAQKAKRWPRKSTRVQLCQTSDPATCTS
ncbi:MAG: TadE/TadG family type IV pilus assembly protein [Pseudomonadota bacterium]